MMDAMRLTLPILLFLPFLAVAAVTDVECGPPDFRTGKADVCYTVDAQDADPLTRLAGVVVDRGTGRPLRRATLLDLPGDALAPGRHRVVWDVLSDIPFRPSATADLRLFIETIPPPEVEEEEVEEEPSDLLYYCTFDDADAIAHPSVGPSGDYLGGEFVPGKRGNALRVRKGMSSAIVPFGQGVIQPSGTIEFWAKIENDRTVFGDGGDPRFFMLVTRPGSETVFQLAANDGCGRGGLSIYHQSVSLASSPRTLYPARYESVIPGDIKGWHHYAFVWDTEGIRELGGTDAVAAFIDSNRIPLFGEVGIEQTSVMATLFRNNSSRLFFSLDPSLHRDFNNKTDFLIDEFRIWSVAKTDFSRN
jgi:hypothetical protein